MISVMDLLAVLLGIVFFWAWAAVCLGGLIRTTIDYWYNAKARYLRELTSASAEEKEPIR